MTEPVVAGRTAESLRRVLVPLALAQFICSFAGSNINVMINDISEDLDTTVQGRPDGLDALPAGDGGPHDSGGKLTDRWGRQRCFIIGDSPCTASAR
jgi:hypothetical protein